jgi:hypothetical protein
VYSIIKQINGGFQVNIPSAEKSIGKNGEFQQIENDLHHAVTVLSETWPCKAWAVVRKMEGKWIVACVEDQHYGLMAGDVFMCGDEFSLKAGVSMKCVRPKEASLLRGAKRMTITPILGHIFHPIIDSEGEVYGGVLGMSNTPLDKTLSRSMAMISLLSELIMQNKHACMGSTQPSAASIKPTVKYANVFHSAVDVF